MGHSQAEKTQTRERLLGEAAQQIRDGGLESLSVAGLMQSVGLTHGGFYGHFASRSELIVEALRRALVDGEATAKAHHRAARPLGYADIVRGYVSGPHRDARREGCAIAALAGDVARADQESRELMATHIDEIIALIGDALGDRNDPRAMVAFSAMVGAVALARVVPDPGRSDALLKVVRKHLLELGREQKSSLT